MTEMSSEKTADLTSQEKRALLAEFLRKKAAEAESSHTLSRGQQALWFLYQAAPESAAYNTAFTARILSPVNVPALRRAFQALIDRHPSLRTTFSTRGGEVVQEVHPYQELWFEEEAVSTRSWAELNQRVEEDYKRPFDLERGPALRVTLFTRSRQDHVLLFTIHHIVCDAWSIWLLLDELRLLYPAELAGKPASLPPLERDYTDFIQWQRDTLAGPEGDRLWTYWQKQLAGDLPLMDLPTDRPRSAVHSHHGASHFFKLADNLAQRLTALARAEGATIYMMLLAAFQVLLRRYSGQEDILVGSPTTGRSQAEFAGIVGYFVNPVVMRADLRGNPTFKEFLRQIRQVVLAALAHQDLPFPLLVERLHPRRDPSRSPLFQVFFVFQKPQQSSGVGNLLESGGKVNWGGLDLEPFKMPQMEGQFDLTLEIERGMDCVFKYNTSLFDAATIDRMAGHFQILLEAIVRDPEQRVSGLPLLSDAERHQLLVKWNDTRAEYRWDQCIHQYFEAQAEKNPDAVALVFEGDRLTYRDVNIRANRLAHYLRESGIGPEVLVGICVERSVEMVVGLLAILKAGGAYVPLDPAYPKERLAFMLDDSRCPVLLTQEKLIPGMPATGARLVSLDADWESVSQRRDENPVSAVTPRNLAYVIYTSGSTGQPKGAMNTHFGVSNRLLWMQQAYPLTADDRVLQKTPFSFDVSVWEFFWPLMTGSRLVVAQPGGHQDGAYLARLIAGQGVTTLHFVPSMLQVFLEASGLENCSSLRQVFCSGEALPPELQVRFFERLDAELHNLYGPTEAAVDVTFWRCEREGDRRTVPIGRPIANTQIYILDRHLQPSPIGVPGEIHIGGAGLARGYLNRPDLTAEKFIPDVFGSQSSVGGPGGDRLYRTGDLARRLPDGNIEYLGRMDNQVKVRGFRIEIEEIESALARHADVREAVVILREDRPGDKRLVAYIVTSQNQAPTPGSLTRFLKEKLPEYMVPSVFVRLEALPLTPNGKVNRRALPRPEAQRPELDATYVMPATEAEQLIAAAWRPVLQLEKVGTHDNFFELGGHSLRLAQVHRKLQEVFGPGLSMVEMFQYPTIHSLAEFLSKRQSEVPASEPSATRAACRTARSDLMDRQRALRLKHRAMNEQ
jgi:amino acid adenylation domain-containing protein